MGAKTLERGGRQLHIFFEISEKNFEVKENLVRGIPLDPLLLSFLVT